MATTTDYDITASYEYDVTKIYTTNHSVTTEFYTDSSSYTEGTSMLTTVPPYVISTVSRLDSAATINDVTIAHETFPTVLLAGSIAAIVCYVCIICLLFGMGMKGMRSHIHCNICVSLMTSHILIMIGQQRTPGTISCKAVSLATQFFILAGLTWLILEGVHLFRLSMVGSDVLPLSKPNGRTRSQKIGGRVAGAMNSSDMSTANRNDFSLLRHEDQVSQNQSWRNCCSRLTSYYVIGWVGPLLFIAATVPAVLGENRQSTNCWLVTTDDVIWIFGSPIPAVFLFHSVVVILTIINYKRRIKHGLSLRTAATETSNQTPEVTPEQSKQPQEQGQEERKRENKTEGDREEVWFCFQ